MCSLYPSGFDSIPFESKSTFIWEAKWTQTGMRFYFGWESHFRVQSALYLCLHEHELWRNETQTGMDFISIILPAWDFHLNSIYPSEMNKHKLLGYCTWCACAFEIHCGYGFHIGHFDRKKICIYHKKISYKRYPNETPKHVHQNIGSFWNGAEIKRHMNRTCFHAGLKSNTSLSSFRLFCNHTQAGECWWQYSNSTANYIHERKIKRNRDINWETLF